MREEYKKWHSPILNMDIEMLVFGHAGYPVILFPTTMGSYHENKDFKMLESAKWFIENGLIRVYCPNSIDKHSWYNKKVHPAQRIKNHNWYDKFILEEVVDSIRHNTGYNKICVAGPSFGGFHALNFAFRHPDRVSHLFSMSGAFEVKTFMNGYYSEDVYFNNPIDYIADSNDPNLWQMKIVLGAGEYDICLDANKAMSYKLHQKGIEHWLDVYENEKHDWPLWRAMFPKYLSTLIN